MSFLGMTWENIIGKMKELGRCLEKVHFREKEQRCIGPKARAHGVWLQGGVEATVSGMEGAGGMQ